ncbi:Gldg family protein [bacterium]|nr:Gldg family protein [bacterium]
MNLFSQKFLTSVVGLIALLAVIIIVNFIALSFYVRCDITEARTYSLTPGTKKLLRDLDQDVTLKLFYSSSLRGQPAALKAFAGRVKDLLKEYENASKGSVKVEVLDPKLDSDEEEWALKYGLKRVGFSSDPTSDGYFYFGIVAEALDQNASLPIVDISRERYLEYDVSQLIYQVLHPQKKTIGVISSLPITGVDKADMYGRNSKGVAQPWIIINELKRNYVVRNIKPDSPVDLTGVDMLLVVHPKAWPDETMIAIDQYVMKGGKVIFFVDPLCTADRDEHSPIMPFGSSDANVLFEKWGFTVDPGKVVADLDHPTVLSSTSGGQEKNPLWVSPSGDSFNTSEIMTAQLDRMLLPLAGAIIKKQDAKTTLVPLVSTSLSASLIDVMEVFKEASDLRMNFNSDVKNYPMVAKVSGQFESAFQGKTNLISYAEVDNTIVVFADVDVLCDQYNIRQIGFMGMQAYQPLNNNYTLILNAINQLSGDQNLIAIRARDSYERPFTVVQDLEKKAQNEWLSKEQALSQQYETLQRQLFELQQQKDDSQRMIISPEQEKKIKEFQAQRQQVARELKMVRKNLNRDKEKLGFYLKLINIALVPAIVCLIGIFLAIRHQYRVKQR